MIAQREFGKTREGKSVTLFSLKNKNGMQADVMDYGANLVNLLVPDREGNIADVCLGYDNLEAYFDNSSFFGATVGPVANRTADAKFEIGGVEYQLDVNDNQNNLHSHFEKGLHKVLWDAVVNEDDNSVTFSAASKDGEIGFPGNRTFAVTYQLTDENELSIHYDAESDKDTIVNMTNHSYFNLKGHDNPSILDEKLWIGASTYTEIVPGAIPTGNIIPVAGTPLDFTTLTTIGDRIEDPSEQLVMVKGYDHNYVVDNQGTFKKVAEVVDEAAGRTMEVYSDLPGIQFYAGNCIGEHTGKGGATYGKWHGLALETQYYPNSANQEGFPRPVTGPGRPYSTTTVYKFR